MRKLKISYFVYNIVTHINRTVLFLASETCRNKYTGNKLLVLVLLDSCLEETHSLVRTIESVMTHRIDPKPLYSQAMKNALNTTFKMPFSVYVLID